MFVSNRNCQLTGTVGTVFSAVATPHGRNAVGIVAFELIGPASVIAIHLVGTERAVAYCVLAVVVSIAQPGGCNTFTVAALECRCRTRLTVR